MKIEITKIENIKENKDNPRIIRDEKYKKLVKSIKDFPEMLKIRPIVVDENMIVLGGNMRLKACKEAGLTEIPIIRADELTEEQQREFVIKDNVSFGDWDWQVLTEKWDNQFLDDWGMSVMGFGNTEVLDEINYEDEWVGMPEFTPREPSYKLVIHFDTTGEREAFANEKQIQIRRKQEITWITTYPFKEKRDLTSLKFDL